MVFYKFWLDKILKASVAFVLPDKYSLSVFSNWHYGENFPQSPIKIFWEGDVKQWEKEI